MSRSVPSASVTLSMRRGGTRTPPLAIVWKTDAAWIAVTEMPCPKATVARFVPLHVEDFGEEARGLAGVPDAGPACRGRTCGSSSRASSA